MKKFSTQIFKELASLAENIPSGFRAVFAKSDGFYTKNFAGVTLRFLTDGDTVANADTLDTLHASAFAKIDTAFTSSENILNNYPNIKLYVLNAADHGNLNTTINNLYAHDVNQKIIILQPGAYAIDTCINLESKSVLGIIGCSREDTLIQSNSNAMLSNCILIKNLSFLIKGEYSDTHTGIVISADKDKLETYISNVTIKNTFSDNLNLITSIAYFKCGNNIRIINFTKALIRCSEFSDINIDIASSLTDINGYLVDESVRLTNINILFNAIGIVFNKCSEVSNFNIVGGCLDKTVGFEVCTNISNGKISLLKYGFSHAAFINNVYVTLCIHAFYYSDKISLCFADANDSGFYTCKGLVNNRSTSNIYSQYDASYADMSSIYPVDDTYVGGWNA
ncbi:MAG: hypothetical protein ACOYO1_11155 [Bacteroidales bacterium]